MTWAYYTLPQCFWIGPLPPTHSDTGPPSSYYLQQVTQARLCIQLQPALIWPCLLAATVPTVAVHMRESQAHGEKSLNRPCRHAQRKQWL